MKTNMKTPTLTTFEGAAAFEPKPVEKLASILNTCMLWEDTFYMDGKSVAEMLFVAVSEAVKADYMATKQVILAARKEHNIRHASLMAAVAYAQCKGPDAKQLITDVITRADELAEVLAMAGAKKMPHSVKKGVAAAFGKFNEYQLGKYKGNKNAITLKDAVFLTHPSPKAQPLVQKIVDETLEIPETWETQLSAGGDKKEVFTGLLQSNKLGAMALLRNLRNMHEAGVDKALVAGALDNANWSKVLPFRFMSAVKEAPAYQKQIDKAFFKAVAAGPYIKGKTAVLVDTSGSMMTPISAKSSVQLYEVGAVLATALNGDHVDLYEWADICKPVDNWSMSLSKAMSIKAGTVGWGTQAHKAVMHVMKEDAYDTFIVVTDMQFHGRGHNALPLLPPEQKGYCLNLSPYGKKGIIGEGQWTHLDGWSANILKYIGEAA